MDDQKLIERIRQGEREAFAFLVNRYKAPAFSIAMKILKNSGEAEEVVQEPFVKAFYSINQFRGESKFSTWFYRIVYNSCISQIRNNRKSTVPIEGVGDSHIDFFELNDPLKQLSHKQESEIIQQGLETLNETDFTLIMLFYYEDQSLKEIAKVLGITYGNAKVKIQRARVKLYNILKEIMKTEIYDLL